MAAPHPCVWVLSAKCPAVDLPGVVERRKPVDSGHNGTALKEGPEKLGSIGTGVALLDESAGLENASPVTDKGALIDVLWLAHISAGFSVESLRVALVEAAVAKLDAAIREPMNPRKPDHGGGRTLIQPNAIRVPPPLSRRRVGDSIGRVRKGHIGGSLQ